MNLRPDADKLSVNPSLETAATKNVDPSVAEMVDDLSVALDSAIGEIHAVNSQTKILALNARIEAARAGTFGAAFAVVAEEMQNLSDKTSMIAQEMANRTRSRTSELMEMINSKIRGTRLSDLALVNIDLIDRNLYERTCDVRWWATDGSLVDALTSSDADAIAFSSKRLGVILDAYTVYNDLVLCNQQGTIVSNGRPDQYPSTGNNQSKSKWFSRAMATQSGDEYGFESAHHSSLVGEVPTLAYSCGVRERGDSNGRILGVLGILFDWNGLARPILDNIPVPESEKASTEAYILNDRGQVLASNQSLTIGQDLKLPGFKQVLAKPTGFYVDEFRGNAMCIGHAKAPGFETYSTGWYSIVAQPLA